MKIKLQDYLIEYLKKNPDKIENIVRTLINQREIELPYVIKDGANNIYQMLEWARLCNISVQCVDTRKFDLDDEDRFATKNKQRWYYNDYDINIFNTVPLSDDEIVALLKKTKRFKLKPIQQLKLEAL